MTDTSAARSKLLDGYRPPARGIDEFVGSSREPRPYWSEVWAMLESLGLYGLRRRQSDVRRLLEADGASYRLQSSERHQPWKLDAIPLLVPQSEWAVLEAGIAQRATLLDLVSRDLYGERKLLERGVIPAEVVYRYPGFIPACDGAHLPDGSQLFTYAVDLGRDSDGATVAIADYAQAPSGSGYALEDRAVLSRVFPTLFRSAGVQRIAPYFRALRAGLESLGERTADDPKVVVLSPGTLAETAFEHGYLASYLGYTLVEGADLVVRDGAVFLRSFGALERVDVILRRVDAAFSDPLELLPESRLGVPGLLEASRRQTVALANPLGSGVIENPALGAYLPAACRELLGQELRLPSAPSWWCGEPDGLRYVLDHLDEVVLRPLGRRTPTGLAARGVTSTEFVPATMGDDDKDELRWAVEQAPGEWAAQAVLPLSTAPTLTGGRLQPRRAVLRTYAVANEGSFDVMAGGLTRVAPDDGTLVISNQFGAIAKDTWVLADGPERPSLLWIRPDPTTRADAIGPMGSVPERAVENLFWLGRYAERAESIVRLLRAIDDRRFDVALADETGDQAIGVLLDALSAATFSPIASPIADVDAELASVAGDPSREGSLAFAVSRLLAAAEAVRDRLSIEMWEVTASLERDLIVLAAATPGRADTVQGSLRSVTRALLALHGLVGESMVRDVGWYFLDAGRRIERFLNLATVLRSTLASARPVPVDSLVLESLLSSADSLITYRRRYRSRAQVETVCELLVTDPTNPRALRYQIDRLNEALLRLPSVAEGTDGEAARALAASAGDLITATDPATMADADENGGRPTLVAVLDAASSAIAGAADAVARSSFGRHPPPRPLGQEGWS